MSSVQTTENGLRGGITRRESEVLALVGERLSNREIADRLYISVRTVESHVSALLTKLGVSDRRELVGVAKRIEAQLAKHKPCRKNKVLTAHRCTFFETGKLEGKLREIILKKLN